MSDKIPSVNEFFKKYSNLYQFEEGNAEYLVGKEDFETVMITFAKLHIKAALEAAYNNAQTKEQEDGDEQICYCNTEMGDSYVLDKNSIINSYPLEQIK